MLQYIKLVYIKLPVELSVVPKARDQAPKLVSQMIFTATWWKWHRERGQEKRDRIKNLKARKHFGCPLFVQSTFCSTYKPKKVSRSSSPHIWFSGRIHVKRSKLHLVGVQMSHEITYVIKNNPHDWKFTGSKPGFCCCSPFRIPTM